ncbi:ExeM/NucH family extracellular endonuclease [Aeromonas sp. R6-2]|uniref:ExeM/NucH family extracellular endonuclease n=1 Tax=Aeromonas sp. R6-2 TaxID=3138472 RepID=UPI0034A2F687
MSGRYTLLASAVALALAGQAHAGLLITEYLEGSSNNKAVEISNLGSAPVELADYRLALYANGLAIDKTPTSTLSLQGTLAPGASLVLAHSSANAEIQAKATIKSSSLNFNGDDALVLWRGSEVVDSVGQVGVDPGTAWVSGSVSTLDQTLRRKATVNQGRVDASASFDPAAEFVAYPKDDASGLGCSREGACSDVPPPVTFVCPVDNLTPIPAIQGSGTTSPLVPAGKFEADGVTATRGVVTQVVGGLYKGFFLQDAQGDGDPATSDGIFVYTTKSDPAIGVGAEVCVSGKVREYFNQTQLSADQWAVSPTPATPIAATPLVAEPGETLASLLERHEGMRVRLMPESNLVVTRNFGFDYDGKRNNLALAYGAPLIKSTQKFPAMSQEASDWQARNLANQLVVETDAKAPDGVLPWYPAFHPETGYLRVGDKLSGLEGALGFSYNLFRLVADNTITPDQVDHTGWDRVETPELAQAGDLRVASFNVLNFFTTVVGGDANPTGSNRGALTLPEFELQRAKIVNAITRLNADVVGLMEIENNGYGPNSAIANLVDALNAGLPGEQHYRFVSSPDGQPIGSDAITVGLLYRPARVSLSGGAELIEMPQQVADAVDASGKTVSIKQGMRESLLQRFTSPKGDVPLTLVVNHLKSKGSACFEDYPDYASADPLDQQGHCNALRVSAARVLGERLKGESGDLLLIGDMNAYGMEDPIRALTDYDPANTPRPIVTASHTLLGGNDYQVQGEPISQGAGLVNLNTRFHGSDTFSYSYEGELGNLDHALANASLATKVTGVEDWHINSTESNLFEYGVKYSGKLAKSDNPFSASDHDPLLIAITYPEPPRGTLSLEQGEAVVKEGDSLSLSVTRRDGSFGEASVNWRVVPGTAGAEDLALTNGTLSWADGESGSKTLVVPTYPDALSEGDETFTVELTDASGAVLGETRVTRATLSDVAAVATVQMGASELTTREGQWFVEIPVARSGDLSKSAQAKVSFASGSASWLLDYLPWGSSTVHWAPGEGGVKTVRVLVIDDWFVERAETFTARLAQVRGAKAGSPAATRITIEDNDKSWWPFW